MPLPLPNLNDRTYDDLVEEARTLLVTFAPDLTNHNPSEPLITFTELFAFFTEILLFRTNVVTDANRVSFLKMLNGPNWPPLDEHGIRKPLPATREEVDAEIRRTVLALRETDRAVTPADFEFLALAADPRVARGKCIPGLDLSSTDPELRFNDTPGHVSVVILPSPGSDLKALIDVVAGYLKPRRLLGTRAHVVGALSVEVHVQVTLHLLPDAREGDVLPRVRNALTAWFDPFVGRDGTGWPFGRSVYVSELYRLLDELEGIDFVARTADNQGLELDEVATTPELAGRLKRSADNKLISIALRPDELVALKISDADIRFVTPLPTVRLLQ
jgi:phage-related baseplate assembly protein